MDRPIKIIKSSGVEVPFEGDKVLRSLRKAGVGLKEAQDILQDLKGVLRDGMTTKEIYSSIYKRLNSQRPYLASRYSLKKAIYDFGPTGFPFEKFIARVLKYYGHSVQLNRTVRGKCAAHEIDIVSEKDKVKSMIECKFHRNPGIRSDLKVALYVFGRFIDLKDKFFQPWLITNTKCTTNAYEYGLCAGLKITSWGYPKGESLSELIGNSCLHPVTVISGLSRTKKKMLLEEGLVLCRDIDINEDNRASRILGRDFNRIREQARLIINS